MIVFVITSNSISVVHFI